MTFSFSHLYFHSLFHKLIFQIVRVSLMQLWLIIYCYTLFYLFILLHKSYNGLIYYHHHHHVVSPAWISLTLSCHFSLSFIGSGRSSGLHPISSQSCCMYVRAGCPAFARPYVGVHSSWSIIIFRLYYESDQTGKYTTIHEDCITCVS